MSGREWTFPAFEGRGYAKRVIATLRALAARSAAALVFAHTLPERNASGAALEREGFTFAGEAADPEDGPVWRWERGWGPLDVIKSLPRGS